MIHKYKRLAVGADIQDESKVHKEANYSKVCLFDVETGRLLFTTAQAQFGIDVVAHSPDGKRFITVTDDGCVAVHATRDGREVVTLETERAWLPVTFSPDGHQLIYRQDNGHMRILHSDDWTFPDKEAAFKAALRDVQQELNITP